MRIQLFKKLGTWMSRYKFITSAIVLVVIIIIVYLYRSSAGSTEPQYVLTAVRTGTLTQTVSGSGQVSASNQTDILSQVSGTIQTINVKVGQSVRAGDLIATIDSTSAAASLQSAKISFAKLIEPAKAGDLSNAQNNLNKSYSDSLNSVASTFTDLATVMTGMKDMLYSSTGFLNDVYSTKLNTTSRPMHDQVGISYDSVSVQYTKILAEYRNVTHASPTSEIDTLLTDTISLLKNVAATISAAQNTISYIKIQEPEYYPNDVDTALTNVSAWLNTINSDLSSTISGRNSITSNQNSLTTLMDGADQYDIESAKLNLAQAERTYANYFIRAPYDGIIGRLPVSVFSQAGGSTVIATIIGQQKIATVSLNEVDAAKVKDDQPVTITFDAIDGLNATGTVMQVDQVGTVSSGVVSYGVKILINTDDVRIKPGMSVNTTIITEQKNDVLLVPSSAIKSQGTKKYVSVFDRSTLSTMFSSSNSTDSRASTTRASGNMSSTTRSRLIQNNASGLSGNFSSFGSQSLTISSPTAPRQVFITTGNTDDTNTEILSGLSAGDLVVTKTIAAGSTQTTSATSLASLLSGRRVNTTTRSSTSNTSSGSSASTRSSSGVPVNAGGPPPGGF